MLVMLNINQAGVLEQVDDFYIVIKSKSVHKAKRRVEKKRLFREPETLVSKLKLTKFA